MLDAGEARYWDEVTVDGQQWHHSRGPRGSRGGGGADPAVAAALGQLDQLLLKLPKDARRLPPADRRLLLQAKVGDQEIDRVYDRGNMPDAVWEVLRLGHCGIASVVPEFKIQSEINVRGFASGGFFCLSPDGKELLYTGANLPLQFWDPVSHEFLREIRGLGAQSISFNPDKTKAVIGHYGPCEVVDLKTWQFTQRKGYIPSSCFTRDGRHVVVEVKDRPLQIYDVDSWQRVDQLPEIPDKARMFVPARGVARAVVQLMDGTLSLWDVDQHHEVMKWQEQAQLLQTAFSPDESMVAVATYSTGPDAFWDRFKIAVYRTEDGKLLHVLRPREIGGPGLDGFTSLMWLPDGKYLVVAMGGTHVFDMKTGRHRGELTGSGRPIGMVLVPGTGQFAVGTDGGKIQFWDFPEILKKMREFENSLPPLPQP